MEKITKKLFIEQLQENRNVLCSSGFRSTYDRLSSLMEKISINGIAKMERRTVVKTASNHLVFSNGSSIYFDQHGKKEYFSHRNAGGVKFLLQTTIRKGDTEYGDEPEEMSYILYAID